MKSKTKATEAAKLLAMLVRVNRIRSEVRELSGDPDLERLMNLSHYSGDSTIRDLVEADFPLHQIADGAAIAYAQLVADER